MVLLDIVFSFDSIITAVGMANELWVMAVAIVIAVAVMLAAAAPVAGFINRHPTVKILVLAFLLLIGTALLFDGFGLHVPKGYIYVAIGFSIAVEMLNQLAARRRRPDREVGSQCRGPEYGNRIPLGARLRSFTGTNGRSDSSDKSSSAPSAKVAVETNPFASGAHAAHPICRRTAIGLRA
jgi:Integral membrane protein TerC family